MKQTKQKTIGHKITVPNESCTDKKCPFHGNLRVRGRLLMGTIVSRDVHHSATMEMERRKYLKKFERFELRKTRIHVHNPPCINASIGEVVKAIECRPISKTKKFAIIQKLGEDLRYREKREAVQSDQASQATQAATKQENKSE